MYDKDEIIINGTKLNKRQTMVLIEAIGGNVEFGTQCEGFLEDSGISVDEQVDLVNEIDDLFIR